MTRRALLVASIAAIARADSADQAWELVAAMSSALSEGDAAEFLHAFDQGMPYYQRLRENVIAATRDYEIGNTVDLVSNEGNDDLRTLVADWQFSFVFRETSVEATRRTTRVTLEFRRHSKRWQVVSLEPVNAFDPPKRPALL